MNADRLQDLSRYLRENAEIITTVCVVLSVVLGTTLYLLTREPALPDAVYTPPVAQPASPPAALTGAPESRETEAAPQAGDASDPAQDAQPAGESSANTDTQGQAATR